MESTPVIPPDTESLQAAQHLEERLQDLLASAVNRAFESGKLFNEIVDQQHFLALGFSSFEAYLAKFEGAGFKRSTIFSNMKLARTFSPEQHGALGVGKLRLLLADYIPDPLRVLAEGLPFLDEEGNQQFKPIAQLSCRELGQWIRQMRPKKERPSVQTAPSEGGSNKLALQTKAAATSLLQAPQQEMMAKSTISDCQEGLTEQVPVPCVAPPSAQIQSDPQRGEHVISKLLAPGNKLGLTATIPSQMKAALDQRSAG